MPIKVFRSYFIYYLKTHEIFNNKTPKTIKQYMYNIILPLNFPHIYLHDLYLIKPHQTSYVPTRPVSHYHCSLIPCLLLHVEPSGLFICHILLMFDVRNTTAPSNIQDLFQDTFKGQMNQNLDIRSLASLK